MAEVKKDTQVVVETFLAEKIIGQGANGATSTLDALRLTGQNPVKVYWALEDGDTGETVVKYERLDPAE